MSSEAKREPGQRAYEAMCSYDRGGSYPWADISQWAKDAWAAVEQACAVPASELNNKARVGLADSIVGEVLGYLSDRGALDAAFATWGASMHQEVRRELIGKVADLLAPTPSATPSKSEGEWISVEERLPPNELRRKLEEAERERDASEADAESARMEQGKACAEVAELEAKLQAAEAELVHTREAAELLRQNPNEERWRWLRLQWLSGPRWQLSSWSHDGGAGGPGGG